MSYSLSDTMWLKGIQPNEAEFLWPVVWPFLELANEFSPVVPLESEKALDSVVEGKTQAWLVMDGETPIAGVLTEIFDTLDAKTLEVLAVGGKDVSKWLLMLDWVADWGQSQGCKRLVVTGRIGWQRLLQPMGFEKTAVVLERVL